MSEQERCFQCPLYEDYRFRTNCTISSCKNYSPFTPSRCLGIDTKFSSDDKTITDVELLHYKFNNKEISIKEVTAFRKRAVDRVKSVLVLYRLVSHISEKEDFSEGTKYQYGKYPIIDELVQNKPLRVKVLGFQPWMLKFIFDEKYVSKVVGPKFKVRQALGLKNKEYISIQEALKKLEAEISIENII